MKKRLLSAIVMIVVFVPILIIGGKYYAILGSILGLIGLWELMRLEENVPDYMKLISLFICLYLILYNYGNPFYDNFFSFPVMVIIFFIYSLSVIIKNDLKKYTSKEAMFLFASVMIIGLLFNSFIKIRELNLYYVFYCFVISIATDTFAYLGGSYFGKRKLAPKISPNKTIEGSIIGSLFGMILGSIFFYYMIDSSHFLNTILFSLGLTIISQIGDLFFSGIKRSYKIKDFSNLIPGHGGILDRLDSVLFVILGFLLYIIL